MRGEPVTAAYAAALHVPDETLTALAMACQGGGTGTYREDCDQARAIAIPVMAPYLSDLAVRVRAMAVAAPDDSAAEAYREAARHIAECAERLEDALTAADY